MDSRRKTNMSKALSYLLRHGAVKQGLPIDSAGYVPLSKLLTHPSLSGATQEDIIDIVRSCPKQRFEQTTRAEGICIRATQGHTMQAVQAEDLLTPIRLEDAGRFPVVMHGTFRRNLPAILREGLSRMQRQHIHFATQTMAEQGVSGLRGGTDTLISLNLLAALQDGIPFYVSSNHVVLSPGLGSSGCIPPRYFAAIYEVNGGTLQRLDLHQLFISSSPIYS